MDAIHKQSKKMRDNKKNTLLIFMNVKIKNWCLFIYPFCIFRHTGGCVFPEKCCPLCYVFAYKMFSEEEEGKKCDYYLFSWHIFVSRPVVPFSTSYMQSRREMNKTPYLFMWRPELSFITQHTSVVIWTVAQPVFIWFLLCLFYCRFFFWLF